MTAGVAVKNWGTFSWATYNWALSRAPANTNLWTSATLAPEAGPNTQRSLACTVTVPYAGQVSVLFGTRAGRYDGKTRPIAVPANTATVIRLTDLKPGTTYYANPQWTGQVPNSSGLAQSGTFQFGELSAATP